MSTDTDKKRRIPPVVIGLGVAALVMACGCLLAVVFSQLGTSPRGATSIPTEGAALVVSVLALTCGVLVLVAGLGVLLARTQSRTVAKKMEPVFEPLFEELGLSAQPGTGTTKYDGTMEGRKVRVRYGRRYTTSGGTSTSRYTGSTVEAYVEAPALSTRTGIAPATGLGQAVGRFSKLRPVEVDDMDYSGLMVHSRDPSWTQGLLADERAKISNLKLMGPDLPGGTPQVLVIPGSIYITINRVPEGEITTDLMGAWLEDAIALAEVAEAQPAPAEPLEAKPFERRMRGW